MNKALTVAELRERHNQRQRYGLPKGLVEIAQVTETVGALERLKKLAAESHQSVQEYVASQQLLLREKATSLAESEFCLEPDEIELYHRAPDHLPLERRQHVSSCTLCLSIVKAAENADCEAVGEVLAQAVLREAVAR